jgi:hypothetical protein
MPVRAPRLFTRALASLALVPLLIACTSGPNGSPHGSAGPTSSPTGSQAPSPAASPAAAASLILRITSEGGFIGPAANLAALPQVSVYSDGRIMGAAPIDAMFPGPLLPVVAVRDVGASGEAAIVAAIRAAGLDGSGSFGPGVPGDTGTTIFSVKVDGAVVVTRMALGGGLPGRPGAGNPDPAAAAAADLLNRLTDPTEAWGATKVATSTLVPTAYRIYVAPGAPAGDGTTSAPPAVAWPLTPPLSAFGVPANPDRGITGLRQGAVFGADATALGPVLSNANALTPFSSEGMLYTLYVRPLLPDEVPTQG